MLKDTPMHRQYGLMKRKGCSILFVNDRNEILLFLRDDKSSIPYPNMWDALGGQVEEGETPEQGIRRELKEELGLDIDGFQLFSVTEHPDRTEYTFWQRIKLEIENITLNEGQCLKWFTEEEIKNTNLAFGFNPIIESFFRTAPFRER
jgi:8-oxo-dGTP diphosphatase